MRTKYAWDVTLQAQTGEVVNYPLRAYWDPEQEETCEAVKTAAAVEAWWKSGKKTQYLPIAAALV